MMSQREVPASFYLCITFNLSLPRPKKVVVEGARGQSLPRGYLGITPDETRPLI